jgi:hypothetical protein
MSRKLSYLLITITAACVILGLVYSAAAKQGAKGKDRILSKVTFIHFKKGHAKPPWAGGGKPEDEGTYRYISKGAKWKIAEDLLLNPICGENPDGSLDELIIYAVAVGMDEWETASGTAELVIFGGLVIDENVSYNNGEYRGSNTLSFGGYSNPDVIAVTSVWGYFTGPPPQREIVEAHILMNDDFEWGDADVNSLLMDVQNIATHELGHWAGMGDVYKSTAAEETMYGYSTEGETKKRDLYKGDIAGITGLY